jgi:hypothetical protein
LRDYANLRGINMPPFVRSSWWLHRAPYAYHSGCVETDSLSELKETL